MKKWLIISMVLLAVVVFLFIFVYYRNFVSLSPEKPLSSCQVLLKHEGANKIDIVFLTNKVSKDKLQKYADFLVNSEPFNSNKEKFSLYYAGEADCSMTEDKILFCYSMRLIKDSSACPNDYIIVLTDKSSNIRSSSYDNVVSININHPYNVLLHEFGHTFAALADEYVPSVIPRGSKNCAKACEKFPVSDSCFIGCSEPTYYRSSEESVMRTLKTSDYKKLNTMLIKNNLDKYG